MKSSVLVGFGYWGKIISGYLKGAGFEPACIYSRDPGCSFEDFLKEHKPETVFICSPVSTHFEYAKQALLSGCDVFCEKMLANDPGKVRELYNIADSESRVLFTDYIYLYSPSIRKMKELAGDAGSFSGIDCIIGQYGKFYTDVDVIGNIGVHMISAAGYLTDFRAAEDVSLNNCIMNEGTLNECVLEYKAGEIPVCIGSSLISADKIRKITVAGGCGELMFDMNAPDTLVFINKSGEAERYPFDEHNNLQSSLDVFRECIADPSNPEYKLNRDCCVYVEELTGFLRNSPKNTTHNQSFVYLAT